MHYRRRLLIAILFFTGLNLNYASILEEDIPEINEILQLSYEEAILEFHKIIDASEKSNLQGAYAYYFGRIHFSNGQKDSAVYYWNQGYNLLTQVAKSDTLLQHKLAYNCGIVSQNAAEFYNAIQFYKKASQQVISEEDFAKCNIKIGVCFQDLGEYTIAEYYLKWALSNLETIETKNAYKLKAEALGAIGVLLDHTNQPDSALYYINKRLETIQLLEEATAKKLLIPTLMGKGNALESKQNFDEAISNYKASLNAAIETDNYTFQFRNYCNLGLASVGNNDFSAAIKYLDKAKNIAIKEDDYIDIAAATNTFADIYFKKGDFTTAIKYYFESLNILLEQPDWYNLNQVPTIASVQDKDDLNYVFEYVNFINKSLVAKAQQSKDESMMKSALQYIHFSDSLLFITNQQNLDNQSRFYWREKANELYGLALEAAIFLNDESEQFYFIERGKYFVLRSLMSENLKLKQLSTQEQTNVAQLQEKISQLEIKSTTATLTAQQLADLIEAKEAYHNIVAALSNKTNAKEFELNEITLEELQSNFLSNDSTLYITYLESSDATYALYVNKNGTSLKKINHKEEYSQLTNSFIQSISKPIKTTTDATAFLNGANQLYRELLPSNIDNYSDLIINPSGMISYISFDALCSNVEQKELLIQNHVVRYTLSPAIEMLQESSTTKSLSRFLLVAPIHFKHIQQHDLPNSENEVEEIHTLTGGKLLMANAASKANFQKLIHNAENIHLATHSMANVEAQELPWIAFSDGKMYLPEIYNLPLKDKFVVLSACETFRGEVKVGEGIMNLVWALHYAGSKSMVATLWNTYDIASNEIMQLFYSELKLGHSKTDALRNAKLEYIKKHGLKPDQWASFIYIGDDSNLKISKRNNFWIYISFGILVICLLSIFGIRNKVKTKA